MRKASRESLSAKRLSTAAFALFLLGAPSAWSQTVDAKYDKSTNFSAFKTYSWTTGTPVKNPIMDQRIVADIDTQLAARGLTKVGEGASADLVVLYHGSISTNTPVNNTGLGGLGIYWGNVMTAPAAEQIPIGQLVVDIGDAKTKKLLWLGTAKDTLGNEPSVNTKKIDAAVTMLFKKYPIPAAKK
jgi:hypothetical protein